MEKHYHYHVTFRQSGQRLMDSTPWTTEVLAVAASVRYFTESEQPKVVKVDATETCGHSTY